MGRFIIPKDYEHWFYQRAFYSPHCSGQKNSPGQWRTALPPTAGSCGKPGWHGRLPSPLCPGSGERQWRGEGGRPGVGGPRCWTRSSRHSCRDSGWRTRDKDTRLTKAILRVSPLEYAAVSEFWHLEMLQNVTSHGVRGQFFSPASWNSMATPSCYSLRHTYTHTRSKLKTTNTLNQKCAHAELWMMRGCWNHHGNLWRQFNMCCLSNIWLTFL